MAIVKAPALSLDASGNLGGICYSRWRGRNVARQAWTGTQTSSADQLTCRGYLTTISQAWAGSLTEAMRQVWEDLAKVTTFTDRLGVKRHPNGYNLFISRNMHVFNWGYSGLIFTPVKRDLPVIRDLILTYQPSYPRVQVYLRPDISTPTFDGWDVWRAGPFSSEAYHAIEPEYRLIGQKKTSGAYNDTGILAGWFYWYKCRFFTNQGEPGNFIHGQIETA